MRFQYIDYLVSQLLTMAKFLARIEPPISFVLVGVVSDTPNISDQSSTSVAFACLVEEDLLNLLACGIIKVYTVTFKLSY